MNDVDVFNEYLNLPDEAGIEHLPLRIRLYRKAYAQVANDKLAEIGTTVARYRVLLMIYTHPGLSGVKLAQLSFQKPQSLADVTLALESQQLIERRVGHGRAIKHYLTTAGEEQVIKSRKALLDLNHSIFENFDQERIKRLVNDLSDLTYNILQLTKKS